MSIANAAHCSMMLKAGSPTPPGPAYWGLCFTAEEPNVVVNMAKRGSPSAVTLETSTDGLNWTSFDADGGTTPVTLANIGDHVFFRAGSGGNTSISRTNAATRSFTITGLCSASGNINSLLDSENQIVTLSAQYCFARLFYGCTSLTTAPELPATTLADSFYRQMFYGCTSLTTAPELPATTFATNCYRQMFYNCTSLNNIKASFLSWTDATTGWVTNVAASGTFRCPTALGTDSTITRGANNCPAGWTVINID